MKIEKVSVILAAALALGLASCSKKEPVTPTAEDANKAAVSATDTAAKTAEAVKADAEKAADTAKVEAAKAADTAKAAATSKTQELIDKAKGLVAEGKFSEASSVLQQLGGQTLSDEQTKLVNALKEQIQKALAAQATEKAAGSVGGLLKP